MILPSTIDPIQFPGKPPLLTDAEGLVTLEVAAAYFDVEVKRLRGWLLRNAHGDPIGDALLGRVYPYSLERYLRRVELLRAKSFSDEGC